MIDYLKTLFQTKQVDERHIKDAYDQTTTFFFFYVNSIQFLKNLYFYKTIRWSNLLSLLPNWIKIYQVKEWSRKKCCYENIGKVNPGKAYFSNFQKIQITWQKLNHGTNRKE